MGVSITDELIHTTVRIDCRHEQGKRSSGTGFIFNFCEHDGKHVPAIITNKHVISGAKTGKFHVSFAGEDGSPVFGEHIPVQLDDFEAQWIRHPDSNIDLAAFPFAPVVRAVEIQEKKPFYKAANKDFLADPEFMKELNAVEDILMIGYPTGLWDEKNNLPIVRQGITATPPYIDFEGRPEFLIDCACFPGSSGSPVILYNVGSFNTGDGKFVIGGQRAKLLGILWGAPQYIAPGEIKAVPVPTAAQIIAELNIPINLGFCVKADQLLAFETVFDELVVQKEHSAEAGRVEAAADAQ